jgi:hypothetical protein
MAIGDVIARLSVSLGLETAAFEKGAKKASNQASQLQTSMAKAGNLIAGAFALSAVIDGLQKLRDATRGAVEAVGGLGEAAQQLGVTTDALQEYRYIATQVGVSTEEMDASFGQLTKRLGEAAQGSKGPTDALKLLGISLDDIKGKNAGDVMPLIADGLSKIKDPAAQAAIAVDLFGKAGQKLLPLLSEGSAGIQKMIDAAKEMGLVLTPEEIANADKYGDAMAALDAKVNAQMAGKLAKNAEELYRFEKAIADTKLTLIDSVGTLQKWADGFDAYNKRAAQSARENGTTIQAGFRQILAGLHSFADGFDQTLRTNREAILRWVNAFKTVGRDIVLGLVNGIKNAGPAAWAAITGVVSGAIEAAKKRLDSHSPSRVFMEIGDYIGQGLAIGIEGSTGRVTAATKKMTEAARKAAEETKALLDRLFPEIAKAKQYGDEVQRIGASGLSQDAQNEARRRLGLESSGYSANDNIPIVTEQDALDVTKGMDEVLAKMDLFGKKAGSVTVNVAKSFKDMADATVQSLSILANSIKGGGFLDILGAVIGLGLQLGSIGAFGKGVAGRINAPGRALGGPISAGRPYMVGERGPELVVPRNNGRVIPNSALGGGKLQVEVIANNNGFGAIVRNHAGQVVAEAAPSLMQGGAQVAQSQMAYRNTRRVA